MATAEQYLALWFTYVDLVAHLKASLGVDQNQAMGRLFLLLLFPKALKPTQTTLTVNRTLLRQTSVISFRWRAPHFAVRVTLTIAR